MSPGGKRGKGSLCDRVEMGAIVACALEHNDFLHR